MTVAFVALAAILASTPRVVEQDGVRVEVDVRSHQYFWTVTNVDAPPITRFEVGQRACYAERAPDGWRAELDERRFRAWAERDGAAIRTGRSATFRAQFSSAGAVLGSVPATVGFGSGEPAVEIAAVWGPTAMPPGVVLAVALTIVVIGGIQAACVARRPVPLAASASGHRRRRSSGRA